ncbi:hypothetical protein AC249_AIPGENE24581 [Exaiptasia diaphana]|nr:hypothetical protein AC249_AIPGENE24581 [Exaiptasia diaphana]
MIDHWNMKDELEYDLYLPKTANTLQFLFDERLRTYRMGRPSFKFPVYIGENDQFFSTQHLDKFERKKMETLSVYMSKICALRLENHDPDGTINSGFCMLKNIIEKYLDNLMNDYLILKQKIYQHSETFMLKQLGISLRINHAYSITGRQCLHFLTKVHALFTDLRPEMEMVSASDKDYDAIMIRAKKLISSLPRMTEEDLVNQMCDTDDEDEAKSSLAELAELAEYN